MIFGFFRKRMRKEHLKLISECSQMARRLQRLSEIYGKSMGDENSLQMAEDLATVITELDEVEVEMDRREVLSPAKAQDYLRLHAVLAERLAGMDKGKEIFNQKFNKENIKKEVPKAVDEGFKSVPDPQDEITSDVRALFNDATDDNNVLSFISFRKNVTGQFNELIERHYTGRSREGLEKAIRARSELLSTRFVPHEVVEQFLGDCYEFSKEKGYWEKDTAAIFDQITRHASIRMQLMHIVESVNDTKFTLFQLAVLTFALKAHNDPLLKEEMGIK
jgi:hypothetical protein